METSKTVCEWGTRTFGDAKSLVSYAVRAKEELNELISALEEPQSTDEILLEVADVTILMHRIAGTLGSELSDVVNTKMLKNRRRKWISKGDGTGSHL